MILYREDRVAEAYKELEAGYSEALKLPFAKKFHYGEPVYIPVPVKGFIDSSVFINHHKLFVLFSKLFKCKCPLAVRQGVGECCPVTFCFYP